MKNYVYKLCRCDRNIDLSAFKEINRLLSKGWQLECVEYDEKNDQLIFRYKREITV